MAKLKCTHFIHLLKGLQNKNIGRVSILTFEQITKRAVHHGLRFAPLSKNWYERLLDQGHYIQKTMANTYYMAM